MARPERHRLNVTGRYRNALTLPCAGPDFWRTTLGNVMTSSTVQAVLLVLCAAIMNAAYTLPMKLNKKWEWEHSWFAFSVLGVAVVPTLIALATIPMLWSTYSAISWGTLVAMALFGVGWGVSLVFFGLA